MPRRLRQCVEEEVLNFADALTEDPRGEISELLALARQLDVSLANELEGIIHFYAAESAIAGFMVGWEYSQNPGAVMFVEVDERYRPYDEYTL